MELSFDQFVNQQIAQRESEPFLDPDEVRGQWMQVLERFNEMVEDFLREYIDQKKIRIGRTAKEINDEIIGPYKVESLMLEIGVNRICIDPVGRFVVGAAGRVDMNGPHGTVKFLLVPTDATTPRLGVRVSITDEPPLENETGDPSAEWVWKIGTPPPNTRYIELEKESFHAAIMEVVNG